MTKIDLKDPKLLCDKAYINGAWQNSHSGDSFEILNPATGEVIIKVTRCGQAETTEAIAAAQTAFETWQHVGAKERSALLICLLYTSPSPRDS